MSDRNAGSSVSSETRPHTGSEDSGIASLVVIAQLSGVAVSAERLKHLSGLSLPKCPDARASGTAGCTQSPLDHEPGQSLCPSSAPAMTKFCVGYFQVAANKCANDNVLSSVDIKTEQ